MACKSRHVADNANIFRLLPDAHFKDTVLGARQGDQRLQTPQAGLRRHDDGLLDGTQRRQRGITCAEQPQFHGVKVVTGARDPLHGDADTDI
ncbi:hypothetical protein QW131_15810 [Roseibium salinum]|nr:hypothetical protein [Roseibium salinum]